MRSTSAAGALSAPSSASSRPAAPTTTCDACDIERMQERFVGAKVVRVRDAVDADGRRRMLFDLKGKMGCKFTVAFELTEEPKQ